MSLSEVVILATCFIGSLIGTYLIIPKIISVVTYKQLMDDPNERSSHSQQIPSLGGLAFFISFILGFYLLQRFDQSGVTMTLVAGLLVLFIIGLKDDLVVISPLTKLSAQLIASGFVLFNPDFQVRTLHDFIGIEEINIYLSVILFAFMMTYIINAFNLIDGIDGLASIVAIVIFAVYGIMFFMLNQYFFLGICLLAIGSLISFLRYNLSADKKIFMGDTGSMILGFMIAILTIRFFSMDTTSLKKLPFQIENLPLIVMAILIVPLFDTSRVFIVRLSERRKPFSPDRNHIHHLLIDYLGLTHKRASIFIGLVNVIFATIFLVFGVNYSNVTLLIFMITGILLFIFFFFRIDFSYKNLRRRILFRRRIDSIKKKTNLNF